MTAQARQREAAANASKATKDVERLKPLLAKDEISQQQYDAAVAAAATNTAATESAQAQIKEAELGIRVAESRLAQAGVGRQQASAALEGGADRAGAGDRVSRARGRGRGQSAAEQGDRSSRPSSISSTRPSRRP